MAVPVEWMHGTFAASMKRRDETRRSPIQESKSQSSKHDGLVSRITRTPST
jgi:hypothetical protein